MGRTFVFAIVFIPLLRLSIPLFGQAPPQAKQPAFEVASVKTNTSGEVSVSMMPSPDGITFTNYTLQFLLRVEYRVQDFQIINGPAWLTTTRFDVTGKAGTTVPQPELRLMLQSLLQDRFKLAAHNELRNLPVYALRRARTDGTFGPHFRTPSNCLPTIPGQPNASQNGGPAPCDNQVLAGRMASSGVSMQALAVNLSLFLGRTVIDRTGFTGTFDYDLTWTPEFLPFGLNTPDAISNLTTDASRPPLPTALQEQLGLKLESTKAPADVLVIDHVERPMPD